MVQVRVPAVIEHLHAGAIGVAQADAFGRAAANPRCGGQLVDHLELLLGHARSLPFDGFHISIQAWEQLADADGANRDAEACHENRFFSLSFFDGVGRIHGQCGALDFEAVEKVFEQYQRAEWLADWDDAKARYGEDVAGSMLARTNAQRAWDAFMRMLTDAVSAPPGSVPPEPVVNLVWSEQHAEAQLARSGLIPEPPSLRRTCRRRIGGARRFRGGRCHRSKRCKHSSPAGCDGSCSTRPGW